jgi:hypothetical protein
MRSIRELTAVWALAFLCLWAAQAYGQAQEPRLQPVVNGSDLSRPYPVRNSLGFCTMTPGWLPMTPGFRAVYPGFIPITPGFAPIDPGFRPWTPGFQSWTPGFRRLGSGFREMRPRFRPLRRFDF